MALIAVSTPGAVALAADPDEYDWGYTQAVTVPTNGLDLSTPAGQTALQRRLDAAIRRVCGAFDVSDLQSRADYKACEARSSREALVQVRSLISSRKSIEVAKAEVKTR